MPRKPANIKVIVAAGVSAPDAIRSALPETLAAFAERNGFSAVEVSRCIHGHQRHDRVRAALASELHVEREWLNNLLDAKEAVA